ncbi:MAG: sugar phosphate isomerase/epimerase [Chitinophagaceae bacterium]|nr:MAG: sugar phosphate isomerase/epimerase [Chitinophagaceae bacterium]
MNYHRRTFLKLSATVGAGLALSPFANGLMGCSPTSKLNVQKNFGLQLYTLRDDLPKDARGVLTQVASFGYKEIESYEGAQGIFWGLGNTGFKKLMDDLGMNIVSSHCDINKDFDSKAAEAAAIGMKYLICPYLGPQKSIDDFKRFADTFNQRGEVCKKNGIRFAYHNHDYGFKLLDGKLPQDVLMQNTDKDLVDYEMDIYWVVTAGQDPEAWFKKYPDRFRLCHIKDRQKNVPLTEKKNVSVVVGTGSIDFPAVLKTGAENGLQHFIVEQEAYEGTTPLASTKANAEYMKNFRFA